MGFGRLTALLAEGPCQSFLVSGHCVGSFPADRPIRVGRHVYEVSDLHLLRIMVVSDVLTQFASAFAIFAATESAAFIRGASLFAWMISA